MSKQNTENKHSILHNSILKSVDLEKYLENIDK